MACPCCNPDTCSGNVTFTISNFSSVALSNGQPYLGIDNPDGVYSGPLQTLGLSFSCFVEAFGSQFTLGGVDTNADCRGPGAGPAAPGPYSVTVSGSFQHPASGMCSNISVFPSCGIGLRLVGRRGAPTFECFTLAMATKTFQPITIAQLNQGLSLTQNDFNVFSPGAYLSSYTLSFGLFIQRSPLP